MPEFSQIELLPFKIKPWEHQREGIEKSLQVRDFAFFFEQGCGKTGASINTLRNLYSREKRLMRTLILCPVVVCENWRREFQAHSQIGHAVTVLKGSQKERLADFRHLSAKNPPHIFVTNYESMQMKELLQEILKWQVEVLVCDESQRLKNYASQRAKMVALIAKGTRHNYILSGTPILNNPMDIYMQYLVLDRGQTFGYNFFAFRATYFEDKNFGMPTQRYFPNWKMKSDMIDPLQNKIYQKAMRVLKKDCLDLPDIVRVEVPIELSSEQAKMYREMKNDFITFLDSEACTATIAIVKALRLQQIVTGYIKTDLGEEIHLKENPRLTALEDLLEDIPETEKVIIWACFKENYKQISKLLDKMKIKHTALHGEVTGADRQKNIDAFQKDPSVRIMIANQAAGGVGVNLTAASYSIFYSRNFSLEQDLQAEARNHRGGSEIHQKITRIDLIASKTIDEIIAESLRGKQDLATKILELRTRL